MIEVSTTNAVNQFHRLLSRLSVEKLCAFSTHGRAKARLIPDCDFLPVQEFAAIFKNYHLSRHDVQVAEAIGRNIRRLDQEELDALAH